MRVTVPTQDQDPLEIQDTDGPVPAAEGVVGEVDARGGCRDDRTVGWMTGDDTAGGPVDDGGA